MANKKAILALDDCLSFLKKLALAQKFDYSPDELLKIGWEVFQKTEKDLAVAAKKIDPSKSWEKLIKELRQERQLEEHTLAHLPMTVLHESYPGHHLQHPIL